MSEKKIEEEILEEVETKEVKDEEVKDEEVVEVIKTAEEILQEKIDELTLENTRLKNEYAKAYADTQNIQKRLNKEFETSKKYRIQGFALDILPALDNLERAINDKNVESESYKKGIEMIYGQLLHALNKEGVEEVESLDLEFDPNFHQAIMTEPKDGVASNTVIEVLQKGYKLKDRILRAAMVKVSE